MNCRDMSDIALKTAAMLDPSIHLSSQKYPKDLGSWGLDEPKLDELIRHLKNLTVELKVYDINDEEFPTFKGKNLLEIELKSDTKNARKVIDVLKRIKAFPIEEHHITNLPAKKIRLVEEEKLDSVYPESSI